MLPSFFCDLSPENFLWRRIFFLLSRNFFFLSKTFFFLRRKNFLNLPKNFVKLPKFFLTEVKVLNFFTFWAVLRDVKKVDKVILLTFSKQARRKEKSEMRNERPSGMVSLKPHRRSYLITLKPHNLTLKPHKRNNLKTS